MADTSLPGGAPYIIGDTNVLNTTSVDYSELASEVETEKKLIIEVDTNLYNAFVGTAGDAFHRAALKIESMMFSMMTRYNNASSGLLQTGSYFTAVDDEQKDNIETQATPVAPGGGSGSGGGH